MSNPWFRMYHEFASDPKIQALSESLQRRYVMLLCLKCNGDLDSAALRNDSVTVKIISAALRITEEETLETKKELISFGLIGEDWSIGGWEKRQYISDLKDPTNAERQKRYREKKRNEDELKRNGRVTAEKRPDTDTDTEKNKDSSSEAVASDLETDGVYINPPEKPKPEKFTADDYRFAEGMAKEVLKIAPKTKPPNLARWADTIRLMREQDGHSHSEIADVFRFANRDAFWKANILSPDSLRKQFAKLDAKMRNPNEKRNGTSADKWTIDHDDTSWLTGAQGSGDCIDGELDISPDEDNLYRLEAGGGRRH